MGCDVQRGARLHEPDSNVLDAEIARATVPLDKRPGNLTSLRNQLLDVMWDDVGVMRDANGLQRGLRRIDEIDVELSATGVAPDNLAFNLSWHDWLNLRSLVDMSKVIASAALSRENSRGAHFREDFPETGAMDDSYFTVVTASDQTLSVTRAPVQFTIVTPGDTLLGVDEAETLVGAAR
jgi:fumarate reductase flavoprotein subunit